MENIPLPEFQHEFSQRDGIRKFHYKPPETIGDLSQVFPFMEEMNNCSPQIGNLIKENDKVSSSQIASSEADKNGSKDN